MNTFLGVVRFDGASIGEDELRKLAERTDFPGGGALSSGSFWGAISDPPPRTLPECENVSLFSDLLLCNGEEVARSIGARSNDEETIFLEAYQHYGEGFASRFVGDFSFAIIEESNRRLLLGRDAVGVKSLFLARERDGLFFSNDFGKLAGALVPAANAQFIRDRSFRDHQRSVHRRYGLQRNYANESRARQSRSPRREREPSRIGDLDRVRRCCLRRRNTMKRLARWSSARYANERARTPRRAFFSAAALIPRSSRRHSMAIPS